MDRKPDTSTPDSKKAVVMGGGLAGLSAACYLLDGGYRVTLIEKRPFLGGRAYSFFDREAGCEVDNGQHVFVGRCTYYIDFLQKVGALHKTFLQDRLMVKVLRRGKEGALYSVPRLGSLHLLPSLLTYSHIGLKDKLLALYSMLRMKFIDREADKEKLDSETFYDWLRRHHQSQRSIDNLWNLIILPILNEDVRSASAYMALMVIQEGVLRSSKEATIGYSRVGLTSLSGESAQKYIVSRGGEVLLGKTIRTINVDGDRVANVEFGGGQTIEGDVFVSALPFDVLPGLLPAPIAEDPSFLLGRGLTSSPIVGIHIWYDRPVMGQEFAAFLDSPVQWVFNKTLIQGLDGSPGQYLCISLSGAWRYVDMPKEELRTLFTREMEALFPKAKGATIEKLLIVKQPQATFRSVPGASRYRPSQETPLQNLFLAGEWTDTGWPSTMEGAVRSGVFAAKAVASDG